MKKDAAVISKTLLGRVRNVCIKNDIKFVKYIFNDTYTSKIKQKLRVILVRI